MKSAKVPAQSPTPLSVPRRDAARRQQGASIVDFVTLLAVGWVVVSVGLSFYADYSQRARLLEASTFLSEMRDELESEYSVLGNFPSEFNGSKSRLHAEQSGNTIPWQESRKAAKSQVIDDFYYEHDSERGIAFLAVHLNGDLIESCDSRCTLHLALVPESNGLEAFCGRWSQPFWHEFPVEALPKYCRSFSVSADLLRQLDDNGLEASLRSDFETRGGLTTGQSLAAL
ncbi:MAG: hypothetical protein AAF662_08805 [Pseudomonadota bacterium]